MGPPKTTTALVGMALAFSHTASAGHVPLGFYPLSSDEIQMALSGYELKPDPSVKQEASPFGELFRADGRWEVSRQERSLFMASGRWTARQPCAGDA